MTVQRKTKNTRNIAGRGSGSPARPRLSCNQQIKMDIYLTTQVTFSVKRNFVIITLFKADIFVVSPLPRSKQQFSIKVFYFKHLHGYNMQTKWFIEYTDYITSWFNSQKGSEIFSAPQRQLGAKLSHIPYVARARPSAAERL